MTNNWRLNCVSIFPTKERADVNIISIRHFKVESVLWVIFGLMFNIILTLGSSSSMSRWECNWAIQVSAGLSLIDKTAGREMLVCRVLCSYNHYRFSITISRRNKHRAIYKSSSYTHKLHQNTWQVPLICGVSKISHITFHSSRASGSWQGWQ